MFIYLSMIKCFVIKQIEFDCGFKIMLVNQMRLIVHMSSSCASCPVHVQFMSSSCPVHVLYVFEPFKLINQLLQSFFFSKALWPVQLYFLRKNMNMKFMTKMLCWTKDKD